MGTPEFLIGHNAIEKARERLGRPKLEDQEIQYIVKLVSEAAEKDFLEEDGGIEEEIRETAKDPAFDGKPITASYITAELYRAKALGVEREAITLFEFGPTQQLIGIGMFDMMKGFRLTMVGVMAARDSLDSIMQSDKITLGKVAHAFNVIEILGQDPSGCSLVEYYVRYWRNAVQRSNPFIKTYEVPEFLIVGAELAAKTYKRVYPIAEKVLSSGS